MELSSVDPDSGEHAEALAQLADALWWDGRTEEARRLIENAVAAAHRSGSASAISWVHGNRAHCSCMETDLEQADLDCQVCWEHAMASGDPEDIGGAYKHRLNLLWAQGDLRRLLEHARDHYAWSAGRGTDRVLGRHAGDRAARRGGPERGRGHRARRPGGERQSQPMR